MKKREKKKDFEIKFYESILKERPDFIQVLISLGDTYTRKGFYDEGLEVDKKLTRLKPDCPIVYYNLACSLSLLGKTDEALAQLKKAVLLGYDDIVYMLKDKDLENVRKHPKFNVFIDKLNKSIQAEWTK
ncbi:MAG: hypothetical protein ABH872_02365 [Candidatus Omnitrophota bacterium]